MMLQHICTWLLIFSKCITDLLLQQLHKKKRITLTTIKNNSKNPIPDVNITA